jgi:hypothetical protein
MAFSLQVFTVGLFTLDGFKESFDIAASEALRALALRSLKKFRSPKRLNAPLARR